MRSLLFIGATLMVGAGIYGFVDYKKKNQSAAFKTLYREEKPVVQQSAPEVVTFPVPTIAAAATEEKAPIEESKKGVTKKSKKSKSVKFLPKNFSRAIPEAEIECPGEEVPIVSNVDSGPSAN